jgi:hypothetical protein
MSLGFSEADRVQRDLGSALTRWTPAGHPEPDEDGFVADKRAVITDPAPVPAPPRKELIDQLRRRWCELCDHGATVTVHHVAKLAQLGKPGPGQPAWAALMTRKRRKTLIVCRPCHDYIHASPVANAAQSLESPAH